MDLHMNVDIGDTDAGKKQLLQLFCVFLRSINIEVVEREITGTTFLPGVTIENGKLIIDRSKLLYPGDVLHEAGHIAVSPPSERKTLSDNVLSNRPQAHGEEIVTLLWSYAAAMHLQIDPRVVFHKHGYKGDSDWLIANFEQKKYIGLPLLVWMGMTLPHEQPQGYPHMQKWLRERD
jgi:hypothetical protein